jgi:hypothetical protein
MIHIPTELRPESYSSVVVGTVIGAVRVNQPHVYRNDSYECAAWWEERTSETGIFLVRLAQAPFHPHYLSCVATLPAKVTNDWFPGLWCGVSISNEPYKPKHIGEAREIKIGIDLVEAIEQTGRSPSPESKFEWYMAPEFWHVPLWEAERELNRSYDRLPEFWNEYRSGEHELAMMKRAHPPYSRWSQRLEDPRTYDDVRKVQKECEQDRNNILRIDSRIGMVGHMAEIIGTQARKIQKIRRQMQYMRMLPNSETDSWIGYHNANCAWAREAMKLGPFTGPTTQW